MIEGIYDNIHNNIIRKAKIETYQELRYALLISIVITAILLGILYNNSHLVNHAPVFIEVLT